MSRKRAFFLKMKEAPCGCRGDAGDLRGLQALDLGNRSGDRAHERGLAAPASPRNGRHIGTIGFNHKRFKGKFANDIAQILSAFERENAGKGNKTAGLDSLLGRFKIAAEAVQDEAAGGCIMRDENLKRIGLGLARVWAALATLPWRLIWPCVLMLCQIGSYMGAGGLDGPLQCLCFGALSLLLRRGGFPLAPLVLAFVLGPRLETGLTQMLMGGIL